MATIDIPQILLMFFVFQVSQQNIIVQLEIVQIQSTNVEIKVISKICKFIFSTERAIVSISS